MEASGAMYMKIFKVTTSKMSSEEELIQDFTRERFGKILK
jgi:hypothetical protein